MKKNITKNQALLTAIGFMIGSGIFFRADNIISSTHGNIFISLVSWIVISSTLVFAGISIAGIASQKNIDGGFVGYIEYYCGKIFGEKIGKILGFLIGWYQIVVYVPIMVSIVCLTFSNYFYQLLGIEVSDIYIYLTTFLLVIFMFIWNGISTKIGAIISSSATIIKLIPIIVIGIIGVVFGDYNNFTSEVVPNIVEDASNSSNFVLFFAPMLSMAFAFDGWVSVGSLSRDMKNPKKELPYVFVASIIITSIGYIVYYLGITLLMPASEIVSHGDAHVGIIANNLGTSIFGGAGFIVEKFILFCVIVSVLGTTNGTFMAGTRYAHKLADDDLLIGSSFFKKLTKNNTPFNSSIFIVVVSGICLCLYYIQSLTNNTDIVIDDIPITLNSVFYLILFYISFHLYKLKKVKFFGGVIAPIIATVGQLFIVSAFFVSNKEALLYMCISLIIILIGVVNIFVKKEKYNN